MPDMERKKLENSSRNPILEQNEIRIISVQCMVDIWPLCRVEVICSMHTVACRGIQIDQTQVNGVRC